MPNSALAAIALGSNLPSEIGDLRANLGEAVRRVGGLGRVAAVSGFRTTAPVGVTGQPAFLNGALLLETCLPPEGLMRELLRLEQGMGRVRELGVRKGPRVIDLDLLLYGAEVVETGVLCLPHPAMHERGFVLEPMAEIAPGMMHPVLGKTMGALWEELRKLG